MNRWRTIAKSIRGPKIDANQMRAWISEGQGFDAKLKANA